MIMFVSLRCTASSMASLAAIASPKFGLTESILWVVAKMISPVLDLKIAAAMEQLFLTKCGSSGLLLQIKTFFTFNKVVIARDQNEIWIIEDIR